MQKTSSRKLQHSLSRRRFVSWAGVFLAAVTSGVPTTANAAVQTRKLRKWRCVNQDCEPYDYDPSVGAEHINDPDHPIPPGVAFEELPDDWVCPICGDIKAHFIPLDEWVEAPIV